MNKLSRFVCALFILLAGGMCAQAQAPKITHFDKDGLAFDYPAGWTMQDKSDSKRQIINFTLMDADLQISIYVHRELIDTPDKVQQARTKLVEPYIEQETQQMKLMGMAPVRTNGASTIGGATADVAHLRASLDGSAGETGVYWNTLNGRLVIFSNKGPDDDLKRLVSQLDALRNSISIAPAAGAPAKSK
jgi:hypothetical protein